MRYYITTFLLSLVIACQLCGADTVEGIISEETVWWESSSPYIVKRNLTIARDATLKIEPGVVVKFDKDCKIVVSGTLIACGKNSQPITFTSNAFMPSKGDWFGMYLIRPNPNRSLISNCIVEYAKGAILLRNVSPRIYDNIIRNNSRFGIKCEKGMPAIMHNNISNNGSEQFDAGVSLRGLGTSPKIRFNTISNNYTAGIYIAAEATPEIVYNTIVNNRKYGIYYANRDRVSRVHKCNLYGNDKYEIRVHGTAALDASENFWGMEVTAEINAKRKDPNISSLFDGKDKSQYGIVNYTGWREAYIDIAKIAEKRANEYKIKLPKFNKQSESDRRHNQPRRGYILYTYSDNKRVVLDYGKSYEIEEGMEFEVVSHDEKIGTIEIREVDDKISEAEVIHADKKIKVGDLVRLAPMHVVTDQSWMTSHTYSEDWKRYRLDISSKRYWSNCKIVSETNAKPTPKVKNFFQDTKAKYIWHIALRKRGYVYFRKAFEIEGKPSQGILNVAVSNRSDIYVNGYKIGVCNDRTKVFEFNVTFLLKDSNNIIAIFANRDTKPRTPVGLTAELMLQRTP